MNENTAATRSIGRRPYLKLLGSGATVGIAGCSGDGGSDGDSDDSGGSDGEGSSSSGTTAGSGSSDVDIDGTTIEYWNVINGQSRSARQFSEQMISVFSKNTGVDFNLNMGSFVNQFDGSWMTSMGQGGPPVVMDGIAVITGQFHAADMVVPASEWIYDELDEETLSAIEWIIEPLKRASSGFDVDFFNVPYGWQPNSPFVARADHFEAAGLDIDSDFPPEDYDHLIQVATTLQEDGPGEFGFGIHGGLSDLTNLFMTQWTTAAGGESGMYLTEDWSDMKITNDTWQSVFSDIVDIPLEHGLTPPNYVQMTDEQETQLLINGQQSMAQPTINSHRQILDRDPSLIEDGNIRYGTPWPGSGNSQGVLNGLDLVLMKPPGLDDATWQRKRRAGIEFIKYWLSKDVQRQVFSSTGFLPVRDDVWDTIPGDSSNVVETAFSMGENMWYMWPSHPQMGALFFGGPAQAMQQAYQGEVSPENALQNAYEAGQQLL